MKVKCRPGCLRKDLQQDTTGSHSSPFYLFLDNQLRLCQTLLSCVQNIWQRQKLAVLFSVTTTPSGSSWVLVPAHLVLPLIGVWHAFNSKGPLATLSKIPSTGPFCTVPFLEFAEFPGPHLFRECESSGRQMKVIAVPRRDIKTCSATPRVQLSPMFRSLQNHVLCAASH